MLKKILLVEDKAVIRNSLAAMLERQEPVDIVWQIGNGLEAWNSIVELQEEIDVVLMDLVLDKREEEVPEGLLLAEKIIKEINPTLIDPIKVIIVSSYTFGIYIKRAYESRIHGYLAKDCELEEMMQAIDIVCMNKMYYRGKIREIMEDYTLSLGSTLGGRDLRSIKLTNGEKEILGFVSKGFSDKEIADKRKCTDKAIQAHKRNIRVKLGARTSPHMISVAYQIGLLKVIGRENEVD